MMLPTLHLSNDPQKNGTDGNILLYTIFYWKSTIVFKVFWVGPTMGLLNNKKLPKKVPRSHWCGWSLKFVHLLERWSSSHKSMQGRFLPSCLCTVHKTDDIHTPAGIRAIEIGVVGVTFTREHVLSLQAMIIWGREWNDWNDINE